MLYAIVLFKLFRVEIEFDTKIYKQKCHSINKLMHSTVNQEILKLEKTMDSLHTTLHNVEKTFEMNNVEESSKCWSEMLSIIKPFIGYMIESYIDISEHSENTNNLCNVI